MDFDWKKLLKLKHGEVLGLDIGSSSVRMVQLRKSSAGYSVVAANIAEIAPANDPENSRKNAVQAIRECIGAASVTTHHAVCSVSGPEVAVRHFSFPPLKQDEIEGAVHLEAAQVCPFNVNEGVIDYQIVPNGQDAVRGILVAATNEVIRRKVRLVIAADLECVLMDVDGLALLNCFAEQHGKLHAGIASTVILDVGASCTTLAIMAENKLPIVRNMPYAGRELVSEIAHENGTDGQAVYAALFSTERSTIPADKLQASMARVCEKLVTDVNETLRFHTAQEKASSVDRILVCGGFATANGFVETLARGLSISTVLWNPFDSMHCGDAGKAAEVVQSKGPAMAVAVGLAMRSL